MILAAILLKMGGYGFLRFSLPMLPFASQDFAPFVFTLSVIAIIYTSLVALVQEDMLGAQVSAAVPQPAHGVTTMFITLPNTKIELLQPLGADSPIAKFLERNPDGGIHHVCYEVDDILAARDRLKAQGARVLGNGEPKIGAHGKPVLFLHPKDFDGTLIELEEVKPEFQPD